MGSTCTVALLACLLVLLPWGATSNFLSPLLPPVFGDICKEVSCGKGTCKPSQNTTFPFECECESGWKRTSSDHDDDDLKFLPCVIPNCTTNFACSENSSPVQEKEKPANQSFSNLCSWVDCGGGGKCNKTSFFTHTCDCKEGYHNLLNVTIFPCYRECSLGMDCSNLGINVKNDSSATPALADNSNNQDRVKVGDYFNWLILTTMLVLCQ